MEVVFIIIAIVFVAIGSQLSQDKKVREGWSFFAQQKGGQFFQENSWWQTKKSPYIELTQDGYTHTILLRKEDDDNSHVYTRVLVHVRAMQNLKIYKAGLFSGMGKALGGQDIIIGYPDYDDLFVIKSSHEQWARAVIALNHSLRGMHRSMSNYTVELSQGLLIIEVRATLVKYEELQGLVTLAQLVAKAVDETELPALGAEEVAGRLSLAELNDEKGALTVAVANEGALTLDDEAM